MIVEPFDHPIFPAVGFRLDAVINADHAVPHITDETLAEHIKKLVITHRAIVTPAT